MVADIRIRDGVSGWTPSRWWVRSAATSGVLLLPAALMYSRAIGDGALSVIAALFLVNSGINRSWDWLNAPWTRLMLVFWVWLMFCSWSMGASDSLTQAAVSGRFFLFTAALENWVLAESVTRRRLWFVILGCALWIMIECWQQYLFGVNQIGWPRFGDGALTGPFRGPTAGSTYLLLFFPAFLPLCFFLLRSGRIAERVAGIGVMILAAATMVLIGQRMPALLMMLGLVVSGLLFSQVRWAMALTVLLSMGVLTLLPTISPPTFEKLVVHFSDQIQHFWTTPYGLIFGRAATMVQLHPWLGLGWDGFRDNCMNPVYLSGGSWLTVVDPASPVGCNIHPHNTWLLIATDAGFVGVALFAALVFLWLRRVRGASGCLKNDRQAALLVIIFVIIWPFASATAMFTVPNGGWTFLMIGWGLAEARWGRDSC